MSREGLDWSFGTVSVSIVGGKAPWNRGPVRRLPPIQVVTQGPGLSPPVSPPSQHDASRVPEQRTKERGDLPVGFSMPQAGRDPCHFHS